MKLLGLILVWLLIGCSSIYAQQGNSPNGPPGPEGNPNNPNNGNPAAPAPLPPDPNNPPPPSNPASPEGMASRETLILLYRRLGAAKQKVNNIFDLAGNVIPKELPPSFDSIANIAGLTSAMTSNAQGEAVATDNNIEVRMSQIRNTSYSTDNVFLTEGTAVSSSKEEKSKLGLGVWLVGTGLFSGSDGTYTKTGTITAGVDYFINKHMLIGLLGVYGYSDSSIPDINGHLLGNSRIGGIYYGAWTGKPGLYVTLSGLVNNTSSRLVEASNSNLTNWTGFGSVGYETSGRPWTFGPVASVQFDSANTSSFTLLNMQLHSNSTSSVQSRLGARLTNKTFFLKPQLQLMWEHRYASNGQVNVEYIGITDTLAPIGEGVSNRDSLWGNLSINYDIRSGWSVQGSYNFDVANKFLVQQVDLGLHVSF